MESFLYLSLNRKVIAENLGDSSWNAPEMIVGDTGTFRLRLSQWIGGKEIEVERTVTGLKATLGKVDARPTGGTFAFEIDGAEREFTAESEGDTLTAIGHGFSDDDRIRIRTNDALPLGLSAVTDYFIVNSDENTFQLALTIAGQAVDFSDNGTGTHYARNISDAITWDASDPAAAQELQDAINGLADVGAGKTYGEVTATVADGSWIVTGPDLIPLKAGANALTPVSFVRVRSYDSDDETAMEIRLIQAPIAFTSDFSPVVPPEPYFGDTPQDGGEIDGVSWPEVKELNVPPTFRGNYQIRRNGKRSALLSRDDGAKNIAAAIQPLADDGGDFTVTNPRANVAQITYGGTMTGFDWPDDDLTVSVFSAPAGDLQIELDLNTANAVNLLRAEDSPKVILEFEIRWEDEQDENTIHRGTWRQEITLRRELTFEELENVPEQEWLFPPLPSKYAPFNSSQVITGQQSRTYVFGDGVESVFTFPHGLATEEFNGIVVRENDSNGAKLVEGVDFTIQFQGSDALQLTVLPARGTPAAGELAITIAAAEPVAAFAAGLTLEIGQVNGLEEIIDSILSDIADLKPLGTAGLLSRTESLTAGGSVWTLPTLFDVFPMLGFVAPAEFPASLLAIPAATFQDTFGRSKRPGALLPAVHAAAIGVLPVTNGEVDEPDADHSGQVYENLSGAAVDLPGGGGRRGVSLPVGGYAADDGRGWYEVVEYGKQAGTVVTFDAETNICTSNNHRLANGDRVLFTTDDTLPAGLMLETDYWIINRTATTFQVSDEPGGEAVDIGGGEIGTQTVTKQGDVSFYAKALEKTLFVLSCNSQQLRLGKIFELVFGLEIALIRANTNATFSLVIEIGDMPQDVTPATPGFNLKNVVWRPTPAVEIPITATPVPSRHVAGIRVKRALSGGVDKLTLDQVTYDNLSGGDPPDSANFAVRARLVRPDIENDSADDPRGFVAIMGLDRTMDGNSDPQTLGFARII